MPPRPLRSPFFPWERLRCIFFAGCRNGATWCIIFLPGLLGGAVGARLLPHMPRGALRVLFSLMLLAGGALMLYRGIFHA